MAYSAYFGTITTKTTYVDFGLVPEWQTDRVTVIWSISDQKINKVGDKLLWLFFWTENFVNNI